MPIVVRPVEIDDLKSVAELMVEMDEFYDEPHRESTETKAENMRKFLFGTPPSAYLVVAHDEDDPSALGIAAYSYLWPAVGTSRSLYLKEMYVRHGHRRDGIGVLLMRRLFVVAIESSCSRVEWTTDRSNVEAQRFYSSLGFDAADSKIFFRSEI